jgi:hypothetical protein
LTSTSSAAAEREEKSLADTVGHDRELAQMSATLADGLRRRGVGAAEAALATETGAAVYRVAFQHWVETTEDLDLRDAIDRSFAQLRTLTAPE